MKAKACTLAWTESLEALREALRRDGRLVLKPTGRSMGRLYSNADAIVIEPPPTKPAPTGSVIVFSRRGQWIAHRVLCRFRRAGDVLYVTCGDAAGRLDGDLVAHRDLIGHVTEVRGPKGTVDLRSGRQRAVARARALRSLTAALLRHPAGTVRRLIESRRLTAAGRL
jgi:hypothetical protein